MANELPPLTNNLGYNVQKTNLEIVIDFIHGEMINNLDSTEATWIKQHLNTWNPINFIEACKLWKSMVGYNCKWDYKADITKLTDENYTYDSQLQIKYSRDIWANIHYGYIGKAVGFSEWTLLSGAGLAQFMVGNTPDGYWERRFEKFGDFDFLAALDDPKDQNSIKLGIMLWDRHGRNLTKKELLDSIRRNYKLLQVSYQ